MDPAQGLARALSRQGIEERFEDFGEELQKAMRQGFLALAQEFAERFVTIDGAREIEDVAADVQRTVMTKLAS
jgi:dTMP kinase